MPTNKHTSSDLSPFQKTIFQKLGTQAGSLVGFDLAVDGPLVVQDPSTRVMTGAINSAHAAEQVAAVTAAGGITNGRYVSDNGTRLK